MGDQRKWYKKLYLTFLLHKHVLNLMTIASTTREKICHAFVVTAAVFTVAVLAVAVVIVVVAEVRPGSHYPVLHPYWMGQHHQ